MITKEKILNDEPTMSDLLLRHNAQKLKPFEMMADKAHYDHCISNFACNCLYIISPKPNTF